MNLKRQITFLIVLSILSNILLVNVFAVGKQAEAEPTPYDLVIKGLVDRPLNFSHSELQSFPMVSEVALMQCIGGWAQLYNWTGVPIFFLLSMTGVKSGATEVVFYASDGYSSSLAIKRALHPTTLLALQADGKVLSYFNGYPYRLIVPCKYGYKWVRWITEIEVVDYDYKGTWEGMGFPDDADIPDCTLPSTTPPFENFHIDLGNGKQNVITLSNSIISSFDFDILKKQICFNVNGPTSTTGYCYITIPKKLLWCDSPEQWQVWVNDTLIEDRKLIEDTDYTYIYFTYDHSIQEVQIKGIHVIPYTVAIADVIPNTLNLKSKGKWITCYIKLPEDYNVSDIDISTVKLNGEISAELHPAEIGDYDVDGITDLMVKFNRQDLTAILSRDEATLTITGKLNDTLFEGTDTIRVIDK